MRLHAAAGLAVLLACPAWAQDQTPTVAVPPPPPIVSAPIAPSAPQAPAVETPPPGLVQNPVPGTTPADQSATANSAPAAAPTVPDIAPIPPNTWLPANTAIIGVLDKVDGSTTQLTIPVGGQAAVGDLQVSIQACVTRPPDQVPDAAIFLSVQPQSQSTASPLFRGWMVRSTPGATVVGDGGETFRVINCT